MIRKLRNQLSPETNKEDDEHQNDLVLEGQAEARRLKKEVIGKLDKRLKPLAKNVLKIGLQVKAAAAVVRTLRSQYWKDYNQKHANALSKLSQAMDNVKTGILYQPGAIRAAFEDYQVVAQQHVKIEEKVQASKEFAKLEKLMEKEYAPSVLALDYKAHALSMPRVNWELRYFGASELDKETGKVTVQISMDHETTSSLHDKCLLCHRVVPSKTTRIRCFECTRHSVMCLECHTAAEKVNSFLEMREPNDGQENSWQVARQELLQFASHLDHLIVHEQDSICGLRHQLLDRPTKKSKEAPSVLTTRKLLPKILNCAYANRPFFGVPQEIFSKEKLPDDSFYHETVPYRWFTYKSVWQTISLIARELIRTLPPILKRDEEIRRPEIALFSSASPIYFAMQMACVALGRVSVGMDTSWELNDVQAALSQSKVTSLLLDPDGFRMLLTASTAAPVLPPNIKKILVIATDPFRRGNDLGDLTTTAVEMFQRSVDIEIVFTEAILWTSQSDCDAAVAALEEYSSRHDSLPGDRYMHGLLSSGTSGLGARKGVLIREKDFREELNVAEFSHPVVTCLKSSPAWASGHDTVWSTLFVGGRVGFAISRPKGSSIWPHLYSVKPTWRLSFVPTLISDLMNEFSQARSYFQLGRENPHSEATAYCQQRMRNAWAQAKAAEYLYTCLGGAISDISVGGAMVNQVHIDCLRRILPCRIYQGYGSTEGGGLATGSPGDDRLIPTRNVKFRVESRPELGYTMEDTPLPRGELLILGKETAAAEEWFGDDETVITQKKKYASDGYYHTGDIVEYHHDSKAFRIIDRASSLIKLPDGVFFSPHRVEMAIGDLSDYWVSDHLVAATTNGTVVLVLEMRPGITSFVLDNDRILVKVQSQCNAAGLASRCIPRLLLADRAVDGECLENKFGHLWEEVGCYTSSGKVSRHKVLRRIRSRLEQIDDVDVNGSLFELAHDDSRNNDDIEMDIAFALFDSIGLADESNGEKTSLLSLPLANIGVDSLLWAKLRMTVQHMLSHRGQIGLKVPFFDITERSLIDIARWMCGIINRTHQVDISDKSHIVSQNTSQEKVPSHMLPSSLKLVGNETGNDADEDIKRSWEEEQRTELKKQVHNIDRLELSLFRLVTQDQPFPSAKTPARSINSTNSKTVLLTGATGFLGRHILSTLLAKGIEVVCLVRATSINEAQSRVQLGLEKAGLVASKSLGRQKIVLGDTSKLMLGLERDAYDMLASEIDAIIHAAAVVKMWSLDSTDGDVHDMIYANTHSCVSIARLSAHARQFGRKPMPVLYTSTKSVEGGLSPEVVVEEVGLHYSSSTLRRQPYSVSKLLGETVLLQGNNSFKNALCIMRPPLLTFASNGDANDKDWFVRLLLTVSDLGLSPSKGTSEFLSREVQFEPVDAYARKVVEETFSMMFGKGCYLDPAPMWPDAHDNENKPTLCLENILQSLRGPFEAVRTFAFRSAVLFEKQPPPFFPLVESLLGVEEEYHCGSESLMGGSEEDAYGVPALLRSGLSAFLEKRCPGLFIQ